jgi:hypothetical protein
MKYSNILFFRLESRIVSIVYSFSPFLSRITNWARLFFWPGKGSEGGGRRRFVWKVL